MDANGNYQWAIKGGGLDNLANGLTIGLGREFYIVGNFTSNTTLGNSS